MITPSRASRDTLSTALGQSMYTVTGLYLISGSIRSQCTIVNTGNSFVTYYLPSVAPGDLRSGNIQIFNLYGSATSSDYQIYIDTPYISGIAPLSGVTGTQIKISGSGIRDVSGLYFISNLGTYSGVLTDPVFENSTWIRTGIVPWMSGGLNASVNVKVMSEGGSSTSPTLFYVREQGLSLSGLSNFPVPLQANNFLRGTAAADGLEWQSPTQVREDINAISKTGDFATGNYTISGDIKVTGISFHNTGLASGSMTFRTTVISGSYLVLDAMVGGLSFRGFSYRF